MIRRTAAIVALSVVALLAIAGCSSESTPKATTAPTAAKLMGVWTLGTNFDTPEQPFIALQANDVWSASDGCNRVRGTWKVAKDGALTTTAGPSTMMACDGAQLPLAM